ncbi:flagellar motor protein MotS [Virgibacillus sp. W0430]|uniref:flagellar motor protein MotS n=1 Tax=Virgibacillus sp. W0430 TaxID=3391580 RepID=UPI003F47467E
MRRRRVRRSQKGGAPKWMVTYSDMVTLILVFFILLFSFSQIDLVKFEAVSESFRNRMIFDFYPSPIPMENPTQSSSHQEKGDNSNEFQTPTLKKDTTDKDQQQDSLSQLMNNVENFLNEHGLNDVVSANRTERGVVLVLQERVLFDSGEAEILDSGKPFLNEIGTLLLKIPNHVKVEGHTDNRPISNYRYPSNWELSGARAGSVIRYLMNKNDLDESRFSVAGYGDTRPLVPNDSAANWSQNRRVEIVILEENTEPET